MNQSSLAKINVEQKHFKGSKFHGVNWLINYKRCFSVKIDPQGMTVCLKLN